MADNTSFMQRIKETLANIMGEFIADDKTGNEPPGKSIQADYNQLKEVFDQAFTLMESHFSKAHPDKHYLSSALKFKLPNTERIDSTKQEVTFMTYNVLFARTAVDYLQSNHLANVSVNTLSEPAKVTLSQFNEQQIQMLYTTSLAPTKPINADRSKSFVDQIQAERNAQALPDTTLKR